MLHISSQSVQQPHSDPKSDSVISWSNIPGIDTDAQDSHKDRPSTPESGNGANLQTSSPLTPADELAESTSSLTPAPEPSSPVSVKVGKEVDQQSNLGTLAPPDQPISRLSTPLSELSPSPSATRDEGLEKKEEDAPTKTEESEVAVNHEAQVSVANAPAFSQASHKDSQKLSSPSQPSIHLSSDNATFSKEDQTNNQNQLSSMSQTPNHTNSIFINSIPRPSSSSSQAATRTAASTTLSSTSPSAISGSSGIILSEQKVMTVLELNAELLRCVTLF